MPNPYVDDNGTLRKIVGIYVDDNGTLRQIQSGWVNDNGTLRKFYENVSFPFAGNFNYSRSNGSPVQFQLNGDGNGYRNTLGSLVSVGAYIAPASQTANYDVRLTPTSGTFSTGTINSFVALGANPTWSVTANLGQVFSATGTLDFRRTADSVIVYSNTLILTCDRT